MRGAPAYWNFNLEIERFLKKNLDSYRIVMLTSDWSFHREVA